jgi:hypothetical protein
VTSPERGGPRMALELILTFNIICVFLKRDLVFIFAHER